MCDKKNPPIAAVLATVSHRQPVTILVEDDAVSIKLDCATAVQVRLDAATGELSAFIWDGPGMPVASVGLGKGKPAYVREVQK